MEFTVWAEPLPRVAHWLQSFGHLAILPKTLHTTTEVGGIGLGRDIRDSDRGAAFRIHKSKRAPVRIILPFGIGRTDDVSYVFRVDGHIHPLTLSMGKR